MKKRQFEYPLSVGPKGEPVGGPEVEFDEQTKRELLDRLREIEAAQLVRLNKHE